LLYVAELLCRSEGRSCTESVKYISDLREMEGEKIHNEEIHCLYNLPDIIMMIKLRIARKSQHVSLGGGNEKRILNFSRKA
jgi:hypothetical protein